MKKILILLSGVAVVVSPLVFTGFVNAKVLVEPKVYLVGGIPELSTSVPGETLPEPIKIKSPEGEKTLPAGNISVKSVIDDVAEKDLRQELSIKEVRDPGSKAANEVLIRAAKVIGMDVDVVLISVFGYTYKVDTSGAKLVRHYWAESDIDEFSVGDIVNVFGYLDPGNNFLIHAKTVRNVSIQKLHGVFKGIIEEISSKTERIFKLKTDERGIQKVFVTSETKILKNEEVVCKAVIAGPCPLIVVPGSFDDLKVGMRVVVRGIWNRTQDQVQAKLIVVGDYDEGISVPAVSVSEDPRPFFGKKVKVPTVSSETDIAPGSVPSSKTEEVQNKIKEIQLKINELLGKLKTTNQ